MTDTVEEPNFNSLADRIAALNKQPNFSSPSAPSTARRHPPPQTPHGRHQHEFHTQTQPLPTATSQAKKGPAIPPRPQRASTLVSNKPDSLPSSSKQRNGAPPLPARKASSHTSSLSPSPSLPPRRPSGQMQHLPVRRGSNSSDISHLSNFSALSISTSVSSTESPLRKLPPAFDQAKLPPLPPTRRELEAHAKETGGAKATAALSPSDPAAQIITETLSPAQSPVARPVLPPRLPSRSIQSSVSAPRSVAPLVARRLPPPPIALEHLELADQPPPLPGARPNMESVPPPVPTSTRPSVSDLAKAIAVPPRPEKSMQLSTDTSPQSCSNGKSCLVCRDFSGPDGVAAQHPRHTLPRNDPVSYLAHVLCDRFPSLTDKARAIFTWCHHNIAYDTDAFFGDCVKRKSTEEYIFSGLAVCMGYSNVYLSIAQCAGLECLEVTGHGKGYGFQDLKLGDPTPPENPTSHAWNAVRIDGGEWKLLDACWGAGHLCNRRFTKQFAPGMFTMTNERFGLRHYPKNPSHQFVLSHATMSWHDYMWGPPGHRGVEKASWFSTADEEGLDANNFEPYGRFISVSRGEPVVRFQLGKLCPSWRSEVHGNGKPYLWLLEVNGVKGQQKQLLYLNANDAWYWVDVPRRELGAPGQLVKLLALTVMHGKDARGLTREQWESKGSGSWSFMGLLQWELVE